MTFASQLATCALLSLPGLSPLAAQQAAKAARDVGQPSLQAQVDQLRKQQERILQELEEIKALLQAQAARVETRSAPMPPPSMSLNVRGEPFKGAASARVAILEYSDFDCTYCATYAREIYPLIDHAYVQAGTVKYFFRDLPGPEHPNALFKARLARCAGDQGRFWEAHDRLFKDQRPLDGAGFTQFIRDLGLDEPAFQACISSNRYIDAIQHSARLASGMKLNGTPAFIIGTLSDDGSILRSAKVFLGAESFDAFRKVLDDLLKQVKP